MFGKTWGCYPSKYIESMYTKLKSILQGKKDNTKGIFAPFNTLSFLIGENNTCILCQSRCGVSSRPPSNASVTGSKKGGQASTMDDDDDMDIQLDSIINEP